MKTIGLYGGSFDPVHFGHIGLAKQAVEELDLDILLLIPARHQPFKLNDEVAPEKHRLEMLKRSIHNESKLQISEIEFERNEISYTVKTLFYLKKRYGYEHKYFFILGSDAFLDIETWYQADRLISGCSLAVGIRPHENLKQVHALANRISKKYDSEILFLNNEQLFISSTDIKDRLKMNKGIKGMVPDLVEEYIYEQRLYL